ncbi:MAG TPA: hypothetical protein VJS64_05985 [Pyrinomonadaceae bacterium]|nr:hypothetical protein [Pyrinomonadaceae bacterium]
MAILLPDGYKVTKLVGVSCETAYSCDVRLITAIDRVARWGDYYRLGKLSPHEPRRTAITRGRKKKALDQGMRINSKMKGTLGGVMKLEHHDTSELW